MGRAKQLNATEKASIDALAEAGLSLRAIARQLGRSRHVVRNYRLNPASYGIKKRRVLPRKLSSRAQRRICSLVSNSRTSVAAIKRTLDLDVHRTTVWRFVKQIRHIERCRVKRAPALTNLHKMKRLEFARSNMARDWNLVSVEINILA